MSAKLIIAPSILAADLSQLETEIRSAQSGGADWLHVDVMDGSFVPPITFGDNIVRVAKKCSNLPLDVHLMIVNPERHLETFAKAGATSLTVHQEVCPHLHRVVGAIKGAGMKTGIAINPGTPVETVFDVLGLCDLVLVMTVNPGWGGQSFIPLSLQRIERLKTEIDKQKARTQIQVDGGITRETAQQCVRVGATILVAGTSIFGNSDRASAIQALR